MASPAPPKPSAGWEDGSCALVLPSKLTLKEGVEIGGGLKLGKMLGAGVQARVFELVDLEGRATDRVIKINHKDFGHKLLNNSVVWIGMEREWQIGQLLRVALQEPDGTVPGFMKVLDCLARTGKDAKKANFNGMVMERINGWEVWRRIDTPEFCNIHYIRELLFQVFSALDRAQRRLGFHHADLGLRNVMEHYPRLWADVQGEAKSRAASDAAAKANGCTACGVAGEGGGDATPSGSGSLDARGSSAGGQLPPPSPRGSFLESRATARCSLPEPRAGFSCNADGSRMPLGPHIEFKIIDFGVAAFNPTLAQSAGGYEYEEALEKLERVKEALGSGPPGTLKLVSGASLPKFGRGGDAASAIGGPLNLEMVPTEQSNRYRLRLPGASLLARASFTALLKGGKGGSAKAAGAEPPAPAADRRALRATPSVPLGSRKMPMSAIEVMYRKFWKRKGDVYHVLLSLAIVLDDRVWPKEDERNVQLFVSLVYHVTGVKLHARFADEVGSARGGRRVFGRLYCTGPPRVKEGPGGGSSGASAAEEDDDLGLVSSWLRKSRRMHIRLKAHLYPYNSGLLAGEALVAPFFGVGRAPHAALPVCVEAAFPRAGF